MDALPADRPDDSGPLPGLEPGRDCWAEVVADLDRVVGPIRRDARRMHLPASEVDDVVQDALYQAWLKRDEYDRSRPLAPWLRGFGRHEILARLMARSITEDSDGTELASMSGQREPLPDECAEVRESRDRMRALVAHAPSRYREVLLAQFWEGLRISAVARRRGQTPKAIRRCLDRALAWLVEKWREVGARRGAGEEPKKTSESEGKNERPFG